MTAVGRPCVSAASSVGASAQIDAAGQTEARALGDPSGREPAAERGERQGEHPEEDDGARRLPRRERSEHGDHRRERIRRPDRVEPERALPVRRVGPELHDRRPQRLERSAAEHRPRQQRRERGDRDGERREHEPRAAAGEEPQVAAEVAGRGVLRLAVEGLAQLRPGRPQRCELRPRDVLRPGEMPPGAADGRRAGPPRRPTPPTPARSVRAPCARGARSSARARAAGATASAAAAANSGA